MRHTRNPVARTLSLMALAAILSAGCSKDSTTAPEGITIADLVGSWTASSVVFTSQANSSQKFDIVAAGGELRATVLDGGRTRMWLDVGSFSDEWDSLLTLDGNTLTMTPAETSRPTRHYTIDVSADRLTMTSSDASFDFTLSGASGVAATEKTVLVRQ
jgi:hypothetical protein